MRFDEVISRARYADLEATAARVAVGQVEGEREVGAHESAARFVLELEAGPTTVQTWLSLQGGDERGAYFVYVRALD